MYRLICAITSRRLFTSTEAVWEPPDEGYVALPDCAPPEPVKQEPGAVKREPGAVTKESQSVRSEPVPVKKEPESEEPPPPAEEVMGPARRPDPYGSRWETIHRWVPRP